MDYVYGTLSYAVGENPLDYPALRDNPMELWVVATDAVTGGVKYFHKGDLRQDDYGILKASSSIPFICRPYAVQGTPYFDGALGDPVPVQKAFELGCDRVLIIAPDDTCGVDTLKRDKEALKCLYEKGIHDAQRISQFMKN